jgi:hypothetical protein
LGKSVVVAGEDFLVEFVIRMGVEVGAVFAQREHQQDFSVEAREPTSAAVSLFGFQSFLLRPL